MEEISLNEIISKVETFHNKFGIENNYTPVAAIGEEECQLRHRLMAEENNEYLEAAQNNNLVEVADALGDMLYILCGTILKHGMQEVITEVFEEIQRSNMSKLGKDGEPIYREDGKVLQGNNFSSPDIKKILIQHLSK